MFKRFFYQKLQQIARKLLKFPKIIKIPLKLYLHVQDTSFSSTLYLFTLGLDVLIIIIRCTTDCRFFPIMSSTSSVQTTIVIFRDQNNYLFTNINGCVKQDEPYIPLTNQEALLNMKLVPSLSCIWNRSKVYSTLLVLLNTNM